VGEERNSFLCSLALLFFFARALLPEPFFGGEVRAKMGGARSAGDQESVKEKREEKQRNGKHKKNHFFRFQVPLLRCSADLRIQLCSLSPSAPPRLPSARHRVTLPLALRPRVKSTRPSTSRTQRSALCREFDRRRHVGSLSLSLALLSFPFFLSTSTDSPNRRENPQLRSKMVFSTL